LTENRKGWGDTHAITLILANQTPKATPTFERKKKKKRVIKGLRGGRKAEEGPLRNCGLRIMTPPEERIIGSIFGREWKRVEHPAYS